MDCFEVTTLPFVFPAVVVTDSLVPVDEAVEGFALVMSDTSSCALDCVVVLAKESVRGEVTA